MTSSAVGEKAFSIHASNYEPKSTYRTPKSTRRPHAIMVLVINKHTPESCSFQQQSHATTAPQYVLTNPRHAM